MHESKMIQHNYVFAWRSEFGGDSALSNGDSYSVYIHILILCLIKLLLCKYLILFYNIYCMNHNIN